MGPITTEAVLLWCAAAAVGVVAALVSGLGGVLAAIVTLGLALAAAVETVASPAEGHPAPMLARVPPAQRPRHTHAA